MSKTNADEFDADWVFFDLDGTLWDHPSAVRFALRRICEVTGIDHAECVNEFVLQSRILWDQLADGTLDVGTLRIKRFENVLMKFGLADDHCAHEISSEYLELYLGYQGEYPESPGLIEAVSRHARLAILTNAPHETQDAKFGQLVHRDKFEWMLTTDETNCVKTDPRFYQMAWERAGRPDPSRIVYIGDAWEHDIAPTAPLGWNCVWINWKGTEMPEPFDNVRQVSNVTALAELFQAAVP